MVSRHHWTPIHRCHHQMLLVLIFCLLSSLYVMIVQTSALVCIVLSNLAQCARHPKMTTQIQDVFYNIMAQGRYCNGSGFQHHFGLLSTLHIPFFLLCLLAIFHSTSYYEPPVYLRINTLSSTDYRYQIVLPYFSLAAICFFLCFLQ